MVLLLDSRLLTGLHFAINKKLIPHYLLNVVSLSAVLLVFVESEVFAHESGLLAVVVMGMVLGNGKLENLKELLYFKESLSVLLNFNIVYSIGGKY